MAGAAFLHNATEFGISGLREVGQSEQGWLFTGEQRGAFIAFLQARLSPTGGAAAGDALLAGKIGPSRQLMAVAAEEVRDREQFVLLDEQRVAYELVLNAVRRSRESDHKEVVVVTGGPGTGKSVIARIMEQLIGETSTTRPKNSSLRGDYNDYAFKVRLILIEELMQIGRREVAKADIRKIIGKEAGDTVTVRLEERL